MKEQIENRIAELKQRRAKLDSEIKAAEQYLQRAIHEITGLTGAISEMEQLLKDADAPLESNEDIPG